MKTLKFFALALLSLAAMGAPAMANDEYMRSTNDPYQPIVRYSDTMYLPSQDVMRLQRALHGYGYNSGPVDGIVGPITRNAVKNYQEDYDLIGEGAINERTLKALEVKPRLQYHDTFRPALSIQNLN